MKKSGKRPLLAACDIYRPAAIKQLETVGAQVDVPVFRWANKSCRHCKAQSNTQKHGNDIVFLDTAGRLT